MLSKIKTFFELPSSHKQVFIKIAILVPLVEVSIKTIKFKKTFYALKYFTKKNLYSVENEQKLVRRYTNYLYLYQKQFPFPGKCLARSLSLWFLLARKGIQTEMRFGMKKVNGKLLAHAWIEHNGKPLISQTEINQKYIPFSESILTEVFKP